MIQHELEKALTDLGWKYPEGKLNIMFNEVENLPLSYEQILQIGRNIKNKPGIPKIVTELRKLCTVNLSTEYELVKIEEVNQDVLMKSLEIGIVLPMLLFCTNSERYYKNYLSELKELITSKPALYEIAYMWLVFKEYKHDLSYPGMDHVSLWTNYGIYE